MKDARISYIQKICRRCQKWRYTGNLKTISYQDMMEKHPERIVQIAVKGMVAHNKLGRQVLAKLHVYAGSEHPHQAQKPEVLEIKG